MIMVTSWLAGSPASPLAPRDPLCDDPGVGGCMGGDGSDIVVRSCRFRGDGESSREDSGEDAYEESDEEGRSTS
jgi:hypothetical protein